MAEPSEPQIDILLATYNGALFLEDQLRSILGQTYKNWRLLVRDDGSTDRSVDIVERFAKDRPGKIVPIADNDGNLGYTGNFNRLMETSTARYVALCDQDDVWLAHKLAVSMERMQALERERGADTPLLVHTDLCTVDRSLETIGPSFWRYQGLDPANANDLTRLLIHNVVTGCSMLMNRSLAKRALPIPAGAKVHDWWIALVAAAFGSAGAIAEPTLLYRQHGGNATGAKALGGWRFWLQILKFPTLLRGRRPGLRSTWEQAQAFLARYRAELQPRHRAMLHDIATLPHSGIATRLYRSLKHGGPPPGGLYWMAFALFVKVANPENGRQQEHPQTGDEPA